MFRPSPDGEWTYTLHIWHFTTSYNTSCPSIVHFSFPKSDVTLRHPVRHFHPQYLNAFRFYKVQVSSPTITTSAATAKILELEPRLRKDRGCPRFVIFIICLSCLPIILYRWRHAHRPQRQETHHHQHHLWKTLITFTFQPSKLSHTWSSFSTTITKIFFTTTTSSRKEVD